MGGTLERLPARPPQGEGDSSREGRPPGRPVRLPSRTEEGRKLNYDLDTDGKDRTKSFPIDQEGPRGNEY